jgi:hypothetical protein
MPKWDKGKTNDERKKRCAKTTPQQNKGVNHVLYRSIIFSLLHTVSTNSCFVDHIISQAICMKWEEKSIFILFLLTIKTNRGI